MATRNRFPKCLTCSRPPAKISSSTKSKSTSASIKSSSSRKSKDLILEELGLKDNELTLLEKFNHYYNIYKNQFIDTSEILENLKFLTLEINEDNIEFIRILLVIKIYQLNDNVDNNDNADNLIYQYSEIELMNIIKDILSNPNTTNDDIVYFAIDYQDRNKLPIIYGIATKKSLLNEFNKVFAKYNTNLQKIGRTLMCNLLVLKHSKKYFKILRILIAIAMTQRNDFIDIYPWEVIYYSVHMKNKFTINNTESNSDSSSEKFNKEISYIAINNDDPNKLPIICGWANVMYYITDKSLGNQKFVTGNHISSNKTRKFTGIGSQLIAKITEDAENEDVQFLKYTAVKSAIGFYKKQGFLTYFKKTTESTHDNSPETMFKVIKAKPDMRYLESMINLLAEFNIRDIEIDYKAYGERKPFHKHMKTLVKRLL